jgi:hypothetical protein
VRTDAELVAAANENFVASYRKLVQHCPGDQERELGGVVAFVTGLPISLFNGCVALESSGPGDLEAAVEWVGSHGVPHKVFLVPEVEEKLAEVPLAHGLDRDEQPYPGMVLHPAAESPQVPPGVAIDAVDEAGLEEHLEVQAAGGLQRPVARRLFSRSFCLDPDVRLFIGRVDGRAVGASLAMRSERASGVCRRNARGGPPPRGRDRADVGGGRCGSSVGPRHDRAPVVADGGFALLGHGLPDVRPVRELQQLRKKLTPRRRRLRRGS